MLLIISASLTCAVIFVGIYNLWLARIRVSSYGDVFYQLPGPASPSLLFGVARQFWTTDPTEQHEAWKPLAVRTFVAEMVGTGTLLSEGANHRRQRRVVNPTFAPAQTRQFTELFLVKACQLRDILALEVAVQGGVARVDIYSWLHKMSLDVICEAAFGCNIGALSGERQSNELFDAFRLVAQQVTRMSIWPMLRFFFPVLRVFPEEQSRRFARARQVMGDFAGKRIKEKQRELDGSKPKGPHRRGDFLAMLVEANMDQKIAVMQRLSDQNIIDECRTILTAGHDTTAITLSWTIYCLAKHPEIQRQLRNELRAIATDSPTMDELAALHYLDCVLREVVRLYPVLPSSLRITSEDTVLPLGEPININGEIHDRIWLPRNTPIVIPILALNRDKTLWGDDAFDFRPDRWDNLPKTASTMPGIWGNSLTFLSGPHACIGYRFAINEMKATIFTLLRTYDFELGLSADDVGQTPTMLRRPMRLSDPDSGPQLPVLVRPYRAE
ncbi:cytochrome P450 [Trametes coccinea BRFM310]|uniref:Cytochrome P450 n=1 Tax=Trametes coccinea (strain BRFM310) TaxID=1353009 RepID=A0A1Y2IBN5_TRAC3|nr:cytochrome P450 [Trametes coccinea BRFM310]